MGFMIYVEYRKLAVKKWALGMSIADYSGIIECKILISDKSENKNLAVLIINV